MFKFILYLPIIVILFSCGSGRKIKYSENNIKPDETITNVDNRQEDELSEKPETNKSKERLNNPIYKAELEADSVGQSVLKQGRIMALEDRTIFQGSCWDYINEVYNLAGYGRSRKTVFRSPQSGPFASIKDIAPGDWIYHINYGYGTVHSGIFVYWNDEEKMIGTTLSHPGENRNSPGRYRSYDLSGVYQIIRPIKN